MCGIFLAIQKKARLDLYKKNERTLKVLNVLHKRGPDEQHVIEANENITLIHTRLSINGLDNGKQPFCHEEGLYSMVNGEIYNYCDLKSRLSPSLKTKSDCEIIGQLYMRHLNIYDECDGMYAFAVVDLKNNIVILGRDPQGEKPLYCFEDDDQFIASSSQESIKAYIGENYIINRSAVVEYCRYQFNHEYVLMNGCWMIKPGEQLIYNLKNRCTQSSFPSTKSKTLLEISNYSQLWELLVTSVERVLFSEVDISLALSGGLDSSLIAIIASRVLKKDIFALSIDNRSSSSESEDAKKTAQALGINHRILTIDENYISEYLANYPAFDRPYGDLAQIGYNKLAISSSKVLLFGHGLDECLFGYSWVNKYGNLMEAARKLGLADLHGSPFSASRYLKNTSNDFRQIFSTEWNMSIAVNDSLEFCGDLKRSAYEPLKKMYLVENGLMQTDNIGMYHSVESRTPFCESKYSNIVLTGELKSLSKQALLSNLANSVMEFKDMHHLLKRTKKGFSPGGRLLKARLAEEFDAVCNDKNHPLFSNDILKCDTDYSKMRQDTKRTLLFLGLYLSSNKLP